MQARERDKQFSGKIMRRERDLEEHRDNRVNVSSQKDRTQESQANNVHDNFRWVTKQVL